jgi:L-rhamnose isomerase
MENPIYEHAKKAYSALGIDTEKAIEIALSTPISLHCWQGDDVKGFEGAQTLDGGIQATGNYPGAARTSDELIADLKKALSLMPGAMRLNLHANYAIFKEGEFADRDALTPEHFEVWADFAVENGLGLDFNPTFFSHSKVKDGLTLSSPDEETRAFWIRHGIACLRIGEYILQSVPARSALSTSGCPTVSRRSPLTDTLPVPEWLTLLTRSSPPAMTKNW